LFPPFGPDNLNCGGGIQRQFAAIRPFYIFLANQKVFAIAIGPQIQLQMAEVLTRSINQFFPHPAGPFGEKVSDKTDINIFGDLRRAENLSAHSKGYPLNVDVMLLELTDSISGMSDKELGVDFVIQVGLFDNPLVIVFAEDDFGATEFRNQAVPSRHSANAGV
jgi:hypothetical protein